LQLALNMFSWVLSRLVFEDRHIYHGSPDSGEIHEGLQASVSSCAKKQVVFLIRSTLEHYCLSTCSVISIRIPCKQTSKKRLFYGSKTPSGSGPPHYYYCCYCYYYLFLTAVGLTPSGSSTVHIYTQTVQRTEHT
jgi:hypothetical protein